MSITNREKSNLERFGCTFKEETRVFYIDWRTRRAAQAETANIFACLGRVSTESGPIVLLAIELSCIRSLPNYCYFPFDLQKKAHRRFLAQLGNTGEVRFCFGTTRGARKRKHRLTPYLRLRASEVYADALQEWDKSKRDRYDFDSALQLFERHVRIPPFLNRLLLEDTIGEISEKVQQAAQTVPNENRELARATVNEVAKTFSQYYRKNRKELLETLQIARDGLTYINDLHRAFAHDPNGVTNLFSDGLAASFSQKELEAINELAKFVLSLLSLFREEESAPKPASESIATVPKLPPGLADLVHSMRASGISKDAASRFFQLIGMEVGGRPGRPLKDYRREYELKMEGLSWPQVTRQAVIDRQELKAELGNRDFASLDRTEQERLVNRIRQGVRGYARRANQPIPLEPESPESAPALDGEKEIDEK